MRIMAIAGIMVAAMTGTITAHARTLDTRLDPKVVVCMGMGAGLARTMVVKAMTSEMFEKIGVIIIWHGAPCPADGIRITLKLDTPSALKPEALAFAILDRGMHIVVFYDRVLTLSEDSTVSVLLAHVLTHEITHVLQGVARHSDTGLMKARWSAKDIKSMAGRYMEFSEQDVVLIYRGLASRSNTLTPATH